MTLFYIHMVIICLAAGVIVGLILKNVLCLIWLVLSTEPVENRIVIIAVLTLIVSGISAMILYG